MAGALQCYNFDTMRILKTTLWLTNAIGDIAEKADLKSLLKR